MYVAAMQAQPFGLVIGPERGRVGPSMCAQTISFRDRVGGRMGKDAIRHFYR